ncbi:MAG: nuclear transport factor 2 family protein [Terriglobia bacterium]
MKSWLVVGLVVVSGLGLDPLPSGSRAVAPGCQQLQAVTPALREEILAAREAVWRAWFVNNQAHLRKVIPAETVAINAGEEEWQDRARVLAAARQFVEGGGQLVRLEYPHTEIQLYGDVAILYTTYMFETETQGERQTYSGRGTEVFVRRDGGWVNPGWHLDSGR